VEELEPEIWEAFARELLSHTESLASLVGRIRSMDREGLRECLLHAHSIKSLAGFTARVCGKKTLGSVG